LRPTARREKRRQIQNIASSYHVFGTTPRKAASNFPRLKGVTGYIVGP
jgi:hypothetical protein